MTAEEISPELAAAEARRREKAEHVSPVIQRVGRSLEFQTTKCTQCGEDFEYVVLKCKEIKPTVCNSCVNQAASVEAVQFDRAQKLQRMQAERQQHESAWAAFCPDKYRTVEEGGITEMSRLPADKLKRILEWSPASRPPGLLIHGIYGKCKTRCLWRLIRRLFDERKKILVYDCGSFGVECADAFRDGKEVAWYKKIQEADILFFDDLYKMPITDRVEAELLTVIERRGAWMKPIFITTNFTGDALIKKAELPGSKMSLDRTNAIVRRLREDFVTISF